MYPVSAEFKRAVRQSHQMMLRVEVWAGGVQQDTLEPVGGQVEVDARRANRRTCEVVLPATDGIVPGVNPSLLSPYGNELHIWRGIRIPTSFQVQKTYGQLAQIYATYQVLEDTFVQYTDLQATVLVEVDTDEWVPQGVFIITEVDVDSGRGATVTVRGVDRSLRIARNRWTAKFETDPTDTLDEVLDDILRSRWPDVETSFPSIPEGVEKRVFGLGTDNDPWKDAQDIALASGYDLFFDQNGVAVLRPTVEYSESAADEVYVEDRQGMVLSVARGLSSERSYNGVIVTMEGSKNKVFRGEAWDDDPQSPTFRFGPYGRYPFIYSSSSGKTAEAAQAAAELLLSRTKGLVETFEWVQIVDPSLDAGDYIRLENRLANVSRSFVIDRLTLPLDARQPMQAVARTIRIDGRFDEELEV